MLKKKFVFVIVIMNIITRNLVCCKFGLLEERVRCLQKKIFSKFVKKITFIFIYIHIISKRYPIILRKPSP